ncbi:hypothetical protein ABPG74_021095 [Tetrahymena malaccensis]
MKIILLFVLIILISQFISQTYCSFLFLEILNSVYFIQEKNAIVYKTIYDDLWKYSTFDQNGNISATYIIKDLADSYNVDDFGLNYGVYLLQNNQFLSFFINGWVYYYQIDLNLLTSNQEGYIQLFSFERSGCNNPFIVKYGQLYYCSCLVSTSTQSYALVIGTSIEDLQNTDNVKYGSFLYIYQTYLVFDNNYIVYKNAVYTNIKPSNKSLETLILLNGYFLQLDKTCEKTCPDFALVDSNNQQCFCDPNATIVQSKCLCNKKYYMNANKCVQCQSNCESCQSSNSCQTCSVGYYLFPDGSCNLCDIQNGFYTYQLNGDRCGQCQSNCKLCQNSNSCQKCQAGYYLFADGSCNLCNTQNGFYKYQQDVDMCGSCQSNCQTCENSSKCQQCSPGYYLFPDGSCRIQCDIQDGFYKYELNGSRCAQCQSNCLVCQNSEICLQCSPGYFLLPNQKCDLCDIQSGFYKYYQDVDRCGVCSPNCKICENSNKCKLCSPGYQLFPDRSCNKCNTQNGFYIFNKDGENCGKCQPNCQICQDSTNCQQCQSGYYLFPDGSCNQCDTEHGFYIYQLNGDRCGLCQSNCAVCENPNQCQKCSLGYSLFSDEQCDFCTANRLNSNQECEQCTITCQADEEGNRKKKISICQEGFALINSKCEQIYLEIKNSIISKENVEKINESSKTSTMVSSYSSYASNIASDVFNKQNFSIVTQGIAISKLSFLILVDINLPILIFTLLKDMKDQLPSQKFLFLNVFRDLVNQELIQYYDSKFYSADLPDEILYNSGSGIVLFIASLITFILFYALIEKVRIFPAMHSNFSSRNQCIVKIFLEQPYS